MNKQQLEAMETIGQQADTLENLLAATTIPMPPEFHLKMLRQSIPDVIELLKKSVVTVTGENPWD